MDILEIDGSFGEGGGQIVRTAVSLSCITNKPIKIKNIRKNRKVPGLKPQHLTALKILKKICNADVQHLKMESASLEFFPKEVQSCTLNEDVGTAGSISIYKDPTYIIDQKNHKEIENILFIFQAARKNHSGKDKQD